jgi:hypothetical protein
MGSPRHTDQQRDAVAVRSVFRRKLLQRRRGGPVIVVVALDRFEDDGLLLTVDKHDAVRVPIAATEKLHLQLTAFTTFRIEDGFAVQRLTLVAAENSDTPSLTSTR